MRQTSLNVQHDASQKSPGANVMQLILIKILAKYWAYSLPDALSMSIGLEREGFEEVEVAFGGGFLLQL